MTKRTRRKRGRKILDLGLAGIFLLAAYFALFGGEYTVFEVRGMEDQALERAARLAETEARVDSLKAVAHRLRHDPAEIERVARERYGMIRDGEILYRFREPNPTREDEGGEP